MAGRRTRCTRVRLDPRTTVLRPVTEPANARKAASAGFRSPPPASRPLSHAFPVESRKVNQISIRTQGCEAAIASPRRRYAAWFAYETPSVAGGLVWYAYSVIQIGTFGLSNQVRSAASNRGSCESVTFGQRATCVGGRFGAVG